ncbi:MAG: hypothetical protein V4561_05485 [Bacteroidota bacterium]|jgi:hypothetical protein
MPFSCLRVFLLVLGVTCSNISFGQVYSSKDSTAKPSPLPKPVIKRPKPITKETSAGLRLNTDGWTAFFERGRVKAQDVKRMDMFHDVRIFQIEFSERRHPKELRMYGWDRDRQSDEMYVFGKINNFYALKFNWGMRKMLAGKPYPKAVSVHWVYAGGLSLGLLKPYYVNAYNGVGQREMMKYSTENSPYFLNALNVVGAGGFSQGIGEIKIKPGLHLKTALHFDYASDKFLVSAVEIGTTAEIYASKIELMASQKATPFFFNLYAGIQFGKRKR